MVVGDGGRWGILSLEQLTGHLSLGNRSRLAWSSVHQVGLKPIKIYLPASISQVLRSKGNAPSCLAQ